MKRVVFLQHGDYTASVDSFGSGGQETYACQKWSVDVVSSLVDHKVEVFVICVTRDYPLRLLPNGVWGGGAAIHGHSGVDALLPSLNDLNPTHVVLRFPSPRLLEWCKSRAPLTRTLPLLADSFHAKAMSRFRLLGELRAWSLARLLNDPVFPFVANHNLAASRDLQRIGVDAHKIVPWDWPTAMNPKRYGIKVHKPRPFVLTYVGSMSASKGILDVVRAVHAIQAGPGQLLLSMLGSGTDSDKCQSLVDSLGMADTVRLLGKVPHSQVIAELEACDAAVVPSRHEYPEGLPMTIYEALATRTPLILSDHPMFVPFLKEGCGVLYFTAGDHLSLASVITRIMADAGLYESLSQTTEQAWERIQCPVKWDELIKRWLRCHDDDVRWLKEHCLVSLDTRTAAAM